MFPTIHGVAAASVSALPWYRAGGAPAPVAAYQPIGAASLAASLLRIGGTGGNADLSPAVTGLGVSPTWDSANGWIGGVGVGLASGIVPTTDTTVICRISNGGGFFHDPFGSIGTSPAFFLFSVVNSPGFNANSFFNSSGTSLSVPTAITSGVVAIAGKSVYANGSPIGTIAAGTATFVNRFGIMASFTGGTTFTRNFRGNMQAWAAWDSVLPSDQVAAVSAAVALL